MSVSVNGDIFIQPSQHTAISATIEIIPGHTDLWLPDECERGPHHPFLLIEDNLGIPQEVLHTLYIRAVDVFRTARRMMISLRQAASASAEYPQPTDLLVASSSILVLTNPSHQTAFNARKSLVRQGTLDALGELRFTASLLSCQQCVKHGELWHHRRWLFARLNINANIEQSSDTLFCIPYTSFKEEKALISRACELYPRNYFAWMHRLICIRSVVQSNTMGFHPNKLVDILYEEIDETKQWIERHVSDYSAIHYLVNLLEEVSLHGNLVYEKVKQELRQHAISLLHLYSSHETLWMYGRAVFSSADGQELDHFIQSFVQPLTQQSHGDVLLHRDVNRGSLYAQRFLTRATCFTDLSQPPS